MSVRVGWIIKLRAVFLTVLLSLGMVCGAGTARADSETHVYLIRGFLNVFSTGLDELADDLKALGIKITIVNHVNSSLVEQEILAGSTAERPGVRPLIIIGHSWGANAALAVASNLAEKNVPIDLVVTLDPTPRTRLTANVRRYLNYYVDGARLIGSTDTPDAVRARIVNIDIDQDAQTYGTSIGHFTIDSNRPMHREVVQAVLQVLR